MKTDNTVILLIGIGILVLMGNLAFKLVELEPFNPTVFIQRHKVENP